ncbi:hypothetical protein GCM10027422_37690 [Hymenobacter arcticus]
MKFEFRASKEKDKNKFIGSWQEKGWQEIALPFTVSNLISLLENVVNGNAVFTHQDVAHWCDNFIMMSRATRLAPMDTSAAEIADDVSVQWDMFLANTYTFEQLQELDFSIIYLPEEWFVDWLQRAQKIVH